MGSSVDFCGAFGLWYTFCEKKGYANHILRILWISWGYFSGILTPLFALPASSVGTYKGYNRRILCPTPELRPLSLSGAAACSHTYTPAMFLQACGLAVLVHPAVLSFVPALGALLQLLFPLIPAVLQFAAVYIPLPPTLLLWAAIPAPFHISSA